MSKNIFRLVIIILLALAIFMGWRAWQSWDQAGDPETVVAASLQGLKEQNILVPFTARYVAVVTSTQSRLGFAAKKTLIMPGTVRYELDLAALQQQDLSWNAEAQTLTITLPPLRLAGPEIDLNAISEFQDGFVLLTLTDAERSLDSANRKAAQAELIKQARGETPMRLARNAAINAVEQSFAMPLKAAGFDAQVKAEFAAN